MVETKLNCRVKNLPVELLYWRNDSIDSIKKIQIYHFANNRLETKYRVGQ
jgi:hypothetical protein